MKLLVPKIPKAKIKPPRLDLPKVKTFDLERSLGIRRTK